MYRALPDTVHAPPFTTLAEAQAAHVELVDQARLLEERHGNALPGDDHETAAELTRLRRRVRAFEWRLAATGARLPEGPQRGFAQSLLDFWALRQCDLRALTDKFRASGPRLADPSTSGRAAGRLLVPYDEGTAQEAAKQAEDAYAALPTDADREAAKAAFVAVATGKEGSALPAEAPLAPFEEAGLLVRREQEGGATSYIIGHDALATAWPRLAEWLAQSAREQADLERMKGGAEAWARSGSVAELPRGEAIERAVRYSEQDESLLGYVEAARRRRRIERSVSIGGWIFMLVLAIAALWGLLDWGKSGPTIAQVDENKGQEQPIGASAPSPPPPPPPEAPDTGATGWVWIGRGNDLRVVGEGGNRLMPADIGEGARLRPLSNLKLRTAPPADDGKNIAGKRIAAVSKGTPLIVLEEEQVTVKGIDQHWVKVQLEPVADDQLDAQ